MTKVQGSQINELANYPPRALAAARPRFLELGLRVRLPGGVAVLHGGGLAHADPAEQVAHRRGGRGARRGCGVKLKKSEWIQASKPSLL